MEENKSMSAQDAQLAPGQLSCRARIKAYGVAAGVLAAVGIGAMLWFWLERDYPVLRYLFIALALPLSFLAGQWPMVAWLTASARCDACSAPYAVSESDKEETFLSATPRRRESVVGRSLSGPNEGKTLVRKESWTEERYQVVVSYACCVCGEVRQKHSIRTVKANRTSDDIYRR